MWPDVHVQSLLYILKFLAALCEMVIIIIIGRLGGWRGGRRGGQGAAAGKQYGNSFQRNSHNGFRQRGSFQSRTI